MTWTLPWRRPPSPNSPVSSGPEIRPAVVADADWVESLDRRAVALGPDHCFDADGFEDVLGDKRYAALVVELPGFGPAGYCLYGHREGKKFALLGRVVVDPRVRRHGVGTWLVRAVQSSLRDVIPARRLVCHCPEDYLAGQQFLRALGFVCHAVEEDFYGEGRNSYYFRYDAPRRP